MAGIAFYRLLAVSPRCWAVRRIHVPNSLQYPIERHRDLQRKWNRLFQRTVMSDGVLADSRHPTLRHKAHRTPSWHTSPGRGLPSDGVLEEDARFDELIASFGCSNEIAPIELDAFGDRAGKLIAASSSYQPVGAVAKANKAARQ
jgi:hypothetical protein